MTGGMWMDEELMNERCFGCLGASFGDCKICFERDKEKEKRERERHERDEEWED